MWGLQVTIAVARRNLCSDMKQFGRVCLTGRYDGDILAARITFELRGLPCGLHLLDVRTNRRGEALGEDKKLSKKARHFSGERGTPALFLLFYSFS